MSVIGIIGAMEEEVAALKEKMQISGVLKRASMEFYKGTLQENRWWLYEAESVKSMQDSALRFWWTFLM